MEPAGPEGHRQQRGRDTMAEIKIEPKRRSLLPWILGLVLLALVIFGLMAAAEDRNAAGTADHGTATTLRDDTPPRLRQYAWAEIHPPGPSVAYSVSRG